MKRLFIFLSLFTVAMQAQTGFVSYTENTTHFMNPERGLYFYTTTSETGAGYTLLTDGDIDDAQENSSNITLIWREFRLDAFKNLTNPTGNTAFNTFKANMQLDFNKMRSRGVKCIVRFCYTENEAAPADARWLQSSRKSPH